MGANDIFSGRLRDEHTLTNVMRIARNYATWRGWRAEPMNSGHAGRRGILLWPVRDSKPLRLVFDERLQIENLSSCEFEDSEAYEAVVELLNKLAPWFESADNGRPSANGSAETPQGSALPSNSSLETGAHKNGADEIELVSNLHKRLENGDSNQSEIYLRLAQCYLRGVVVTRDEREARKWFEKAAELNDSQARYQLGRICESAVTSEPDFCEAVEYYASAAQVGHPAATSAIARALMFGRGIEQDIQRAFEFLQLGARQDDRVSWLLLGVCFEFGFTGRPNPRKAVRCYDKAARAGNAAAQTNLANFYLTGSELTQNLAFAHRWLHLAAGHGRSSAMMMLGFLAEAGLGCDQDQSLADKSYRQAELFGYSFDGKPRRILPAGARPNRPEACTPVHWFRLLADEGNGHAMCCLGICHLEGLGVHADNQRAFQLFLQAAEVGVAAAQENVARCYKKGIGVEPNIGEAIRYHQMAHEAGHARATFSLGQCYQYGRGCEANLETACELYESAANQGDAAAMLAAGELYEAHADSDADIETARNFYRLAIEAGNSDAKPAVRRADSKLRKSALTNEAETPRDTSVGERPYVNVDDQPQSDLIPCAVEELLIPDDELDG